MTSGKAIATLVLFILSSISASHIRPVKIRLGQNRYLPLNFLFTPIIMIAILWPSGSLDTSTIRHGIVGTDGIKPYRILILFFLLSYMAITLDLTGIFMAAAYWVGNVSGRSGVKLFIYFYLLTTALSCFFGNYPMIFPGTLSFLVYYTNFTDIDSLPWLIAEFAASNTASMVFFVGNPTNVVVCEGFGIENKTLTAWTFFPFAACSVTYLGTLYAQYRATGKLVPRMSRTVKFEVWEAISDLPGAIVGSLLYAGCLVTNLFVPKFDACTITLLFAAVKFIFDIVWDLYRVRTLGIGMLQGRIEGSHPQLDEESQGVGLMSLARLESRRADDTSQDSPQITRSGDPETRSNFSGPSSRSIGTVTHDINESATPTALPAIQEPQNTSEGLEIKGDSPDSSRETVARASPQGTLFANGNMMRSEEDSPPSYPSLPNSGAGNVREAGQVTTSGRSAVWQPWWTTIPFRSRIATSIRNHLPTLYHAFLRLPFALVPFMFSQFILIEALCEQKWTERFAFLLVVATKKQMYRTLWATGGLNIILCNIFGTNIGATILLTKVVHVANLPPDSTFAAGIALAVTSNIGAVNFAVGASYSGLLWKGIIDDQRPRNKINRRAFAKWNILPLVVMTGVALAVVSLQVHIKYKWGCNIPELPEYPGPSPPPGPPPPGP
ncbi:hypothetical protein F5887DRAFT_235583 [Amanita rubescens]|nr:hypothetical protein F5887DRAFT_235583 [Amanita rubescens]